MTQLASSSLSSMPSSFTSELVQAVVVSRSKLDHWVEQQKAAWDAAIAVHEATIHERQDALDQAISHWLSLQLEQGLSINSSNSGNGSSRNITTSTDRSLSSSSPPGQENAATSAASSPSTTGNHPARRKQVLQEQQNNILQDIAKLTADLEEIKKQTQELRREHGHYNERAGEVRRLKKDLQSSKATTIDDLTRGIVNYKYLGLDFEKAEEGRLRFSFSQLDPQDPSRRFSFVVDADDVWSVRECEPPIIPPNIIQELLRGMNETEDLVPFVRGMRRAFCQQL